MQDENPELELSSFEEAINKGKIFYKCGSYQKAKEEFQRANSLDPSQWQSYFYLGNVCFACDKHKQAKQYYMRGLEIQPENIKLSNNLGLSFQAAGNIEESKKIFYNNIEKFPNQYRTYQSLGILYQRQSEHLLSVYYFQEAIRKNVSNPEGYQYLGYAQRSAGQFSEAISSFQNGLIYDSENVNLLNELAKTYQIIDKLDKALEYSQIALQKDPKNKASLRTLGDIAFKRRDFQKALQFYEKLKLIDPENKDANLQIGYIFKERGLQEKANEYFSKVQHFDKLRELSNVKLANQFTKSGNLKSAKRVLEESLVIFPNSSKIYNGLGRIAYFQQNYQEAKFYFHQGLKLDESDEKIMFNLGRTYERLKDYISSWRYNKNIMMYQNQQQTVLQKIGKKNLNSQVQTRIDIVKKKDISNLSIGLYQLGVSYLQNDKQMALEFLTKAIEADPQNFLAHCKIGNIYLGGRQYDLAIQNYIKAMKISPQYPLSYFGLGGVFQNLGNIDDSLNYFQQGIRRGGKQPGIFKIVSGLYEIKNQLKQAKYYMSKAIEQMPSNNLFYFHKGLIQINLQQQAEAVKSFQSYFKYSSINPNAYQDISNLPKYKDLMKKYSIRNLQQGVSNYQNLDLPEIQEQLDVALYRFIQYVKEKKNDEAAKSKINLQKFKILVYFNHIILKIDPNNSQILKDLADIHLSIKNIAIAQYYYLKALQTEDQKGSLNFSLGQFYLSNLQISMAYIYFSRYLQIQGNSAVAYNNIGGAFFRSKLYEQSISYFDKSLKIDENFSDPINNLAIANMELKNIPLVIQYSQRLIKNQPSSVGAYIRIINILSQQRQYTQVIRLYKQLLQCDKHNSFLYLKYIGQNYHKNHQIDLALEYYTKLTIYAPQREEGYFNLGLLHKQMRNFQESIKNFSICLLHNERSYFACFQIATCYRFLENQENAIKYLFKTIQINMKFAEAYYELGCVYLNKNQYQKAHQYFRQTINLQSDFSKAYGAVGMVFDKQNRYQQAIKWFHKAIQVAPNQTDGYRFFASFRYQRQQYSQAIQLYKKCIQINPFDEFSLNNIGFYFLSQRKYEEALKYYLRLYEVNPTDYNSIFCYGFTNLQLKETKESRRIYQILIRIYLRQEKISINHYENFIEIYNKYLKTQKLNTLAFEYQFIFYHMFELSFKDAVKSYLKIIQLHPQLSQLELLIDIISNHRQSYLNKSGFYSLVLQKIIQQKKIVYFINYQAPLPSNQSIETILSNQVEYYFSSPHKQMRNSINSKQIQEKILLLKSKSIKMKDFYAFIFKKNSWIIPIHKQDCFYHVYETINREQEQIKSLIKDQLNNKWPSLEQTSEAIEKLYLQFLRQKNTINQFVRFIYNSFGYHCFQFKEGYERFVQILQKLKYNFSIQLLKSIKEQIRPLFTQQSTINSLRSSQDRRIIFNNSTSYSQSFNQSQIQDFQDFQINFDSSDKFKIDHFPRERAQEKDNYILRKQQYFQIQQELQIKINDYVELLEKNNEEFNSDCLMQYFSIQSKPYQKINDKELEDVFQRSQMLPIEYQQQNESSNESSFLSKSCYIIDYEKKTLKFESQSNKNQSFRSLLFQNFYSIINYLSKMKPKPQHIAFHQVKVQEISLQKFTFRVQKGDPTFTNPTNPKQTDYLKKLWQMEKTLDQRIKIIFCWIQSMAKMILQLEKIGLYHADLHFRNTIYKEGKFLLIDFDYAFMINNKWDNCVVQNTRKMIQMWLSCFYENQMTQDVVKREREIRNYMFPDIELDQSCKLLRIKQSAQSQALKVDKILSIYEYFAKWSHRKQFSNLLNFLFEEKYIEDWPKIETTKIDKIKEWAKRLTDESFSQWNLIVNPQN